MKKLKFFALIIFGMFVLTGNAFLNSKFDFFQKDTSTALNASEKVGGVDSITVGETKEFDVYNGASELTFHIKYEYLERINISEESKIEYHINTIITNKINTAKTSALYFQVYDANTGTNYINQTTSFNLAFNDEWSKEQIFSTPDTAHLKMRLGVKYALSPYYSDYIYLLSFDRPTITDLRVEKNINDPRSVNIIWKYQGDPSIIIEDKTFINGEGIDTDSPFDPTSEKYEVNNLQTNTLYDDWSVTIAYESGFNDEPDGKIVEQQLLPFYTLFNGVHATPNFTYSDVTPSSFKINVEFSGIPSDSFTYTNLHFKSPSSSIDQSNDINVDGDQNLSFDFTVASKQIINDLSVDITLKDKLSNFTTYNLLLDELRIPAKDVAIDNFEIVSDSIQQNAIEINWNITDVDNIRTKIYLYDNISNTEIMELDSLSESNYEISNLNPNTNYNLVLKVDWNNPITNTSGTKESDPISFNTSYNEPKVVDFSLKEHTNNSAILNIKYEDTDKIVNGLTIHDKNNNFSDIALKPEDIDPLSQTYQLNNLELGSYELVLYLDWTSLDSSGRVESDSISFDIFNTPEITKFEISSSQSRILVNWEVSNSSLLIDDIEIKLSDKDSRTYDFTGSTQTNIVEKTIFENLNHNTKYQVSIIVNYTHKSISDSLTSTKEIATKDVPPPPTINKFTYKIQDDKIILEWNIEYNSALMNLSSIKIYDSQGKIILETSDSKGELTLEGNNYPGVNEFNLSVQWEDLDNQTKDEWIKNQKTTVIYDPSELNLWVIFPILFIIFLLIATIIIFIIDSVGKKKIKKEIITIA